MQLQELLPFLIMRHLGEMVVEEPVSGSFSYFANKYWRQKWLCFMSGWNYSGFVCTGEYG